ncbi:helix-turn-helix domain-containing protein [Acidiferrobacter sp.]|jgi:transcriptional regulator with XRE-family HTH domain|uniref:helix-turn-helix domain-containing protein n=1 Tax=Acidiferrobacter sp. TaxID=1872107 RepID=UPI002628D83A|nr:helix-turn-helix domain-containing protein [Acidiferrobacter sp.]
MARTITPTSFPEKPTIATVAEFGAFVRSLRTQQGLRIDDAAALCGVSVALLSALENGKPRGVGLDKALRIADQLGLALLAVPRTTLRETLARLEHRE